MKVLLVGVSCVGKTTVGDLLARRLMCPFYDLDEEIERHFGESIERLKSQFSDYSFRKEAAVVLKRIAAESGDCVIALPPSGLRDAYLRVLKRMDGIVIVLEDRPENILSRITFYDVDSNPLEKQLSVKEKTLYLREIKADISYFRRSYQRADFHVDISGLDAEASAAKVGRLLDNRRTTREAMNANQR